MYILRKNDTNQTTDTDYENLKAAEKALLAAPEKKCTQAAILETKTNTVLAILTPATDGKTYLYRLGSQVRLRPEYCAPGEESQIYTITNLNEATQRCCIATHYAGMPIASEEVVGLEMIEPA